MNAGLNNVFAATPGRAQIGMLPDGRRAHFNDGPIDLVIAADGTPDAVSAAYIAAALRFRTILDELCSELSWLRKPADTLGATLAGRVARRMQAAVEPYAQHCFITPMAAVAGAVAEEIVAIFAANEGISRAYVNNGGDIALHLTPGCNYSVALVDDPRRPAAIGRLDVPFQSPVRGIATSGRHGRSFSLGIADAVTVLATSAAGADAAATIIANAVDLPGHPAIQRKPACALQADSDLGSRPVTVDVGFLSPAELDAALERGCRCARALADSGLIETAALRLRGVGRVIERVVPETERLSPRVRSTISCARPNRTDLLQAVIR
jgi:ApbE superfamily uncharacterized protein (UPF0280 family)